MIDGGAQLTEPDIWELYSMNIAGVDNPYFQEVIRDYARFVSVLGKERVDRKLSQETRNVPEEDLAALPDFNGKRLNIYLSRINAFIRDKNYDEADVAIKEVLGDSLIDKQEFMAQFRYVLRGSYWRDDTPLSWLTRCASYLQYIAYNDDNRTDPYIHQEYAAFLERLIRLTPGAEAVFPTSILDKPEFGVQEYNMRPRNLLPKPKKKKTIE